MKDMAKLVKVRQGLGAEKKRETGGRMKAPERKGKDMGRGLFDPQKKSLCR